MPAPDFETVSSATTGEWKALLAPMLTCAGSAGEVRGYVVVAVGTEDVELRTNLPDDALRALLQMVMPEDSRG
jgi:predicted secreted protein